MRNGEGADGNVANLEGLAGLEILDRRKPGWVFLRGTDSAAAAASMPHQSAPCPAKVARIRPPDRFVRLAFIAGGIGLRLALRGLLAALLQPLGIGHLPARRQPAHPGAVRALGKVHRNAQLARRHGHAVHVVRVLMGNDDGVQRLRLFAGQLHAPEELPAAQPAIHQDARPAPGDNRALPLDPDASTVNRTMV